MNSVGEKIFLDYLSGNGFCNLKPVHKELKTRKSGYNYYVGIYNGQQVFVKSGGIGETCINEYRFTERMWNLNPDHYVKPLTIGNFNGSDYIVLDYCNGISLSDYLKKNRNVETVREQMIEIYRELQKAHVIHRDIRPDNFFLVDGNLKLIDFQFAVDSREKKELECLKQDVSLSISVGEVARYKYKPYAWKDSFSFVETSKSCGLGVKESDLIPKDHVLYMNMTSYSLFVLKRKIVSYKRKQQ